MRRLFRRSLSSSVFLLVIAATLMLNSPTVYCRDTTDPFEIERAAYEAAGSNEERLAIVKEFLADHPAHPRFGTVVEVAAEFLADEMNDRDGAIALVLKHIDGIGDAETTSDVQRLLLRLYGHPDFKEDLQAHVAEIFDPAEMSYMDHLRVIRAATDAEAWTMVDAHCVDAAPLATVEAFRSAYPDEGFSEAFIAGAGRNRQGLLKMHLGWSAANRGSTESALRNFTAADDLLRKSYFGLPEGALYRYWGQTLVQSGDLEAGFEKLALTSIFGYDFIAEDLARGTFAAMGQRPEDYEDAIWQLRREHGPLVTEFATNDYQGIERSYSDLCGEKATLLAFWFPT